MNRYIKLKQLCEIAKMHLYVSLAALFFGVILLSFVTGSIGKYIFSTIFILIYMLALYTKSGEIAAKDKKSYTDDIPYWWKGVILPLGIFAVWIILYILYSFSWRYDIVGYTSGFINNTMFVVWNFIYTGFLGLSGGKFNYWCIALIVLAPVIASGLGYLAGYKGFDLSQRVVKIVYEKKDGE